MTDKIEDKLYAEDSIDFNSREVKIGLITAQDRLIAAKQILLGLAFLFAGTCILYVWKPEQGSVLLEICKTVFPPLATLIIAFYFKDKRN